MVLSQISMGDLKLHHLGTGAIISAITSFVIVQLFSQYNIDSSLLLLLNVGLVALPTGLFIHHKKNKNKVRESASTCLTAGHGVVFTILVNFLQDEILSFLAKFV